MESGEASWILSSYHHVKIDAPNKSIKYFWNMNRILSSVTQMHRRASEFRCVDILPRAYYFKECEFLSSWRSFIGVAMSSIFSVASNFNNGKYHVFLVTV